LKDRIQQKDLKASEKSGREIITEDTKIYPDGRGRVLILTHKKVEPKDKKRKFKGFLLGCFKGKPNNIALVAYPRNNDLYGRSNIYLHPIKRCLTSEDADYLITLGLTLKKILKNNSSRKLNTYTTLESRLAKQAKSGTPLSRKGNPRVRIDNNILKNVEKIFKNYLKYKLRVEGAS